MSKITLNPALKAWHGKVGDLVFKQFAGKEIAASRPKARNNWTDQQKAQRENFKLAAVYGKAVMTDPQTKALYQAKSKQTGVPVFALTVADFFNVPVVDEIDLSGYGGKAGDTIKVRAHDDFKVAGVQVLIRDNGGTVLEQGAAQAATDGTWQYTATSAVPVDQHVVIEVNAADLPGHKGTKTQTQ
jgi:hypothetical protein